MSIDETAQVVWLDDDVPFSTRFDDPFYARSDGRAETADVFLRGNGLPARWHEQRSEPFVICELGFGTGLNFCETVLTWQSVSELPPTAELHFVSFELHPLCRAHIERALGRWSDLQSISDQLCQAWPAQPLAGAAHTLTLNASPDAASVRPASLTVVWGDARQTLPAWRGTADAWFLDGFAPARNPQLWDSKLLAHVARCTRTGGTFSTYTAAGHVRRSLTAAGFDVARVPGFGAKRERLQGVRIADHPSALAGRKSAY